MTDDQIKEILDLASDGLEAELAKHFEVLPMDHRNAVRFRLSTGRESALRITCLLRNSPSSEPILRMSNRQFAPLDLEWGRLDLSFNATEHATVSAWAARNYEALVEWLPAVPWRSDYERSFGWPLYGERGLAYWWTAKADVNAREVAAFLDGVKVGMRKKG